MRLDLYFLFRFFINTTLAQAFALQGDDCAESFKDVRPLIVQQKFKAAA